MKNIFILISICLLWLSACTGITNPGESGSPSPQSEPTTTVPPAPPFTAVPSITAVPEETPTPTAVTPTVQSPQVTPTAEAPPTRIQFDPGATSATINGRLAAYESVSYLARATAGQQMHIEISSTNNAANFALTGTIDGQPYKRLVNEDRFWDDIVPLTQDYFIEVKALEDTDFTLILTIAPIGEETILQPVWPIVDGSSGFLIGGSHNGQWLDALTIMPSLQDGERPYNLYRESQILGQLNATPPYAQQGGPCLNSPIVGFPAASDLSGTIGLVSPWNPIPRAAEPLPTDTPIYQQAVADYLQANGITDPEVNVTRIDKIDFEGDGVYEVIISASRLTGLGNGLPYVEAGDYSLLLLRKVIDGDVVTFPIAEALFPEAVDLADPVQFNIMAYLDLNGNGILELILESFYYEGRFISVHEIKEQGANRVLTAGCRL